MCEDNLILQATEIMSKLKNIIEKNDTKTGRIFDIVIQLLIIISLTSFSCQDNSKS